MKKKWLATFVVMALLAAAFLPGNALAAQAISVTLNGKRLNFDVQPVLERGRVLVPLRAIFEALGATVDWDSATGTVTATKGSNTVKLTIGKSTAHKDGSTITLDVPAKVVRGRAMVPVRFISEALGAQVDWEAKNQRVRIVDQQGKLTLQQAEERVREYLALLDRAVREGVADEEWDGILSQAAINSGYGIDARVFRPVPDPVSSSGRSVSDVEIIKVEYAEQENGASIAVRARYTYNDPAHPLAAFQEIQYEKKYRLVWENGRLVIGVERILELRHAGDIPLITISEKDIEQITKRWQQDNYYTYHEVLAINNSFISPTLSETLGIIKWGDTSTERFKELIGLFSAEVKESKGWKDFINLGARRDPVFNVVWATSTQDRISAVLYGELFPGFDIIPMMMEVEIKKQPGAKGWLFTHMDKVRSYGSLSEMEQQEEPEIYDLLVRMENYRRMIMIEKENQ